MLFSFHVFEAPSGYPVQRVLALSLLIQGDFSHSGGEDIANNVGNPR